MADVVTIRDYFKKLQRVLVAEVDFNLLDRKLIKRSKVDDILCCVYASLPNNYKRIIKINKEDKYPSVNSFRVLNKELSRKFFFNSNLYSINVDKCNRLISVITATIEKDMNIIDNL